MNAQESETVGFSDSSSVSSEPPKIESSLFLLLLVMSLFALSGFSSLVYQVLWTRLLVFVFGSTTFASSTVLAVFMGGLALGAFVAGRFADRLKRPFLWYGILEGVIGVWALLAPHLFDAAIPLYKVIWQTFHVSTLSFSLVRFVVAAAILLIPTTAMGATLPLLSRFVTVTLDKVGNRVGSLYATNTLGAVLGATTAGFYLLPKFGLNATMMVAVAINAALLIIVLLASKKYEAGHVLALDPVETAGSAEDTKKKLPPHVVAVMAAFAVSGAVAMVYEVAWTRTLLMVIGSSTYAFTVMLSTFLVGLFLGSVICSKIVDRVRSPMAWLVYVQVLVFAGGLASVHLFNYIPFWNMQIGLAAGPGPADDFLFVRFLLSAAVLLPITVALGAVFPLVVKACTDELKTVGRSVGTLYSANTLGAIIGAFLAGFVIIPALGVEHTLIWASIANLVIAAGLMFMLKVPEYVKVGGALACLLVMLVVGKQNAVWDEIAVLLAQSERRRINAYTPGLTMGQWLNLIHRNDHVEFFKDGVCATVGVLKNNGHNSLLTNGHVDASDGYDMPNQILIGAYPMLFNHTAKDVAVVGWGSGVSLGTASVFPGVQKLVGIEIEPAVIDASKIFNHVNFKPLENNKVRVELNDGRNYLLATNEKFDAIISEPSNPWQAGVCNLFTKEFFGVCADHLNKGGILGLWLQFEEVSDGDIRRIFSALRSHFKYTVPMDSTGCMVIMASNEPIKMNVQAVNAFMQEPRIKSQMERCGIRSTADLLAHIMCSTDAVDRMSQGFAPNSDDRNYLEYNVGRTYENQMFFQQNRRLLTKDPGNPFENVDFGNMPKEERAKLMDAVAESSLAMSCPERALAWATESYKLMPSTAALAAKGYAYMAMGDANKANACFAEAMRAEPNNARLLLAHGSYLLGQGEVQKAREDFQTALKVTNNDAEARYWMAKTYTKVGRPTVVGAWSKDVPEDPKKVLELLGNLAGDKAFVDKHPDVLLVAGMSHLRTADTAQAKKELLEYTKRNPKTTLGWRGLGSALMAEGDQFGAAQCWQKGLEAGEAQASMEIDQANKLANQGKFADAAHVIEHALEYAPADNRAVTLLQAIAEKDPYAKTVYTRMASGQESAKQ